MKAIICTCQLKLSIAGILIDCLINIMQTVPVNIAQIAQSIHIGEGGGVSHCNFVYDL